MASRFATYGLAAAVALGACAGEEAAGEIEDGFVVEDGKADDFLSNKAKEFVVSGTARVTVEAGQTEVVARNLVAYHHTAIVWFLNQYLVDKEKEGSHADANADYGGFSSMVKNGSTQTVRMVQRNATTWDYDFEVVIAGRTTLLGKLPLNGQGKFDVEIGKPTNDEMKRDAEWYRKDPWNVWNPAMVPASKKETLTLSIREETKSTDGWWDYARLLDDDALTIDVHYGYDYHSQSHLADSKSFYNWLVDRGFRSPVSSYDRLTNVSGAFTKSMDADGSNVTVQVRLFYGKPGTNTDPDTDAGGEQLEKDMLASLEDRDVIVYAGHSGALYGFALSNWDKTEEGDLDDAELAVAQLARDKYQIVFAEGCNTYMLGNTLLNNPTKQGKNVDVITTTNFSVSYSPVQDFLARLLEIDSQSRLRPRTMSATIADLDLYTEGEAEMSMYGIHGIDDNPKLHPFGNLENSCTRCTSTAACGGVGNSCVTIGDSGRRCVAACTDDAACGEGYKCKAVASASSSTIYGSFCVPASRSCD